MVRKIPVRIDWVQDPDGKGSIEITMNLDDFEMSGTSIRENMRNFKKTYLEAVSEVRKIFYGKSIDAKKKYQDAPSSTYWLLGDILRKFNNKIENKFLIMNYAVALERDFGLSKGYVNEILNFVKVFKQNEVFDSIPFSYYRLFMRKRSQLEELGIFEIEKKKFLNIRELDKLPGRENYKKNMENMIRLFPRRK